MNELQFRRKTLMKLESGFFAIWHENCQMIRTKLLSTPVLHLPDSLNLISNTDETENKLHAQMVSLYFSCLFFICD